MKNIKKVLAFALAVLMLAGLVGCNASIDPGPQTDAPTQITQKPTAEATEAPAEETTEVTAPDDGLTVHENTYFTVGYNEEDGWVLAEDDFYTSEYGGNVYLRILDEDGYTNLMVKIAAEEESAASFRSTLYEKEVDMKAYVEGTWVSETIGGIWMAAIDHGDGEWYFLNRDENTGVTYTVYVTDWEDPRVTDLVSNITFTVSTKETIDPPWPWEGEPYIVAPGEELVGPYTLKSEQIPFAESVITYETFDHNIAAVGDYVYTVNDGAVYIYCYDNGQLYFTLDMELEDYDIVDAAAGNVWLSGFMENLLCFDGVQYTAAYEGPDMVSMSPDGSWGIDWFSNATIKKISFDGVSITAAEEYTLAELELISHLCIDAYGNVFACGYSVSDGSHRVFVYNENLELQTVLEDEDGTGLGSVVFATQTENGFLVLDGNMRDVILYAPDGSYIGSCDFSDLFGTDYPWPCDACVTEDGSILVLMTDERADESADEILVFKLSGF